MTNSSLLFGAKMISGTPIANSKGELLKLRQEEVALNISDNNTVLEVSAPRAGVMHQGLDNVHFDKAGRSLIAEGPDVLMTKIAITGATGFIGGKLSRYLKERGYQAIAVVRSSASAKALENEGVILRRADVTDPDSLKRAFHDVDVVIHLAALFNRPDASWEEYHRVNVEGVQNVLEASQVCGVSRVIHCSTVGVATGSGSLPFSETTPYAPPAWDKYETTKCEGEKLALEFYRNTGLPVVVIRPAQVYGPGDRSKAKFYRMVKKGVIVNPGKTLKHLVYIDDLCRAFELAAQSNDAVGEVFIIAGRQTTPLTDLSVLVAGELGVKSPRITLPALPMTWMCASTEFLCNLLHIKPFLFRRSMDFFTKSVAFDTTKATQTLKFKEGVAVPDGVAAAADWYRSAGLI